MKSLLKRAGGLWGLSMTSVGNLPCCLLEQPWTNTVPYSWVLWQQQAMGIVGLGVLQKSSLLIQGGTV